jgi:alpha-glucosidase/alpha-D-xyloside xylohydrolase
MAASVLPSARFAKAATPVHEIRIASVGPYTTRIGLIPLTNGHPVDINSDGSLLSDAWPSSTTVLHDSLTTEPVQAGSHRIQISYDPLTFSILTHDGNLVQKLKVDEDQGTVSFAIGSERLFGLGEGGPQFDRRGSVYAMHSGQGGYQLRTHGGRVPIPWLIGTSGWAMFFHHPFGTFDLTGSEGKFQPIGRDKAFPLDLFVVGAREPDLIMAEYVRLTGHAEMPPLWSFGYQQSHRTLAGREEVLEEARTFREKRLPCDALIYLGTGFCPSGWNTENGSFSWNRDVFSDPKAMLDELHGQNFKAVLHAVILSRRLRGTVHDPCDLASFDEEQASCYWDMHRRVFADGVDGWWPDEGDPLDIPSRLTRIRMYWEGPQIDRPNERPYALHRNGYAGMQRYAAFLWSGDVYSTWETLRTHVPVAINTGLTGIPYWGTDIGGFVPTKELTGELYVRWFQFGSFCTLFRSHGRTWKLRLPWGWDTGELGPNEISRYEEAQNPDPSELHNSQVEPICRKYLELRYRLLPYLYSAVRECCTTGMPVMRSLWLHYPEDPVAVNCGDEYLWGRDILVAPVTVKGATNCQVYLPKGAWYDFWTEENVEGGREISRRVDLATIPLYVRAGAILPLGPVKQFTSEKTDEPLSISVFPGNNASFLLYEDDGVSFGYRKGEWMGLNLSWNNQERVLTLSLAAGSRLLHPGPRILRARALPARDFRTVHFEGRPLKIRL